MKKSLIISVLIILAAGILLLGYLLNRNDDPAEPGIQADLPSGEMVEATFLPGQTALSFGSQDRLGGEEIVEYYPDGDSAVAITAAGQVVLLSENGQSQISGSSSLGVISAQFSNDGRKILAR